MEREQKIIVSLLRGIQNGDGLRFCYQPIFSEEDQAFIGAEQLVRLSVPELGEVSPGEFIPIAERHGLICSLDLRILRHGLELLSGLGHQTGLQSLNINLSPLTLTEPGGSEAVYDLVRRRPELCSRLCLELTETALEADHGRVAPAMQRLAGLGVTLAIDDFGAGESTILRCLDVPFQIVKLDKQLIDRLEGRQARSVLRAVLQCCHSLGCRVVAEGIERPEQYRHLLSLGCTYYQGYYFSRPLPERKWLTNPPLSMIQSGREGRAVV